MFYVLISIRSFTTVIITIVFSFETVKKIEDSFIFLFLSKQTAHEPRLFAFVSVKLGAYEKDARAYRKKYALEGRGRRCCLTVVPLGQREGSGDCRRRK